MNFYRLQKIAPVLNLFTGIAWIALLIYLLNRDSAITDPFLLFFLVSVHLVWLIFAYYYFRQRRFKETIQRLMEYGKKPVVQDDIIDSMPMEAPDALSVKAINRFSFLNLLTFIGGIMHFLIGLFLVFGVCYEINNDSSWSIMKYLSFFLLGIITCTNGLLAFYHIIAINRAEQKIKRIRAESGGV